ncbi:MAG: glutathione peroxidase [Melioribacter sp.]|uniref:glutathione peroxidase n=1 Tax=Rosettibacter primus TaxID=3111523 RepID=UPI00247BA781|nr:glutathione peroxidase [Melioribacter sp.]
MKNLSKKFVLFVIIIFMNQIYAVGENKMKNSIYDITVKDINGKEVKLSDYKGKVLLVVNVASKCGFTPQYEGLQKIYEKYKDKGFEILAFPCNDFGGQEPGSNEEIKEFCSTNYNVTFKLFDKIKVLGNERALLYERLINSDNVEKGDVKWNFEKFLIDKNGTIRARFRSKVKPESEEITKEIEKLLNE